MKKSVEDRNEKPLKLTQPVSASDEVHRIIPLGLTLSEARAWYVNHVIMPRLRWSLLSLLCGSVIVLSTLTELGQMLEQNLSTRMIVGDSLFLVAGFLFAYPTNSLIDLVSHVSDWSRWTRSLSNAAWVRGKRLSILTFGAAASLISYWYLPAQLNSTVLNVSSAIDMRFTLVFAGILVFVGARSLSRRLKLIALVVVGKVLGLYGMFLLLISGRIYSIYPGYEQVYAGAGLLFVMLVLDFTIMPFWLYDYFGRGSGSVHVGQNGRTG